MPTNPTAWPGYEQAQRHVREAEARIARQAAIVQRLREHGDDTTVAQTLLDLMHAALVDFKLHIQRHADAATRRWVHAPRDVHVTPATGSGPPATTSGSAAPSGR